MVKWVLYWIIIEKLINVGDIFLFVILWMYELGDRKLSISLGDILGYKRWWFFGDYDSEKIF